MPVEAAKRHLKAVCHVVTRSALWQALRDALGTRIYDTTGSEAEREEESQE